MQCNVVYKLFDFYFFSYDVNALTMIFSFSWIYVLDYSGANCVIMCSGIFHYVLESNALEAIEMTEQVAHDLLENNKDLLFDLLSLHFVELVCSKKW